MPKVGGYQRNGPFLRGHRMMSSQAADCCVAVACPYCRAAKTWPCTGVASGKVSSTPHAGRWERYRAARA